MPAIVLIIILCLLLGISALVFKLSGDRAAFWLQPTTLFTLPWVVALVVYVLPIFSYREHLELAHVQYIGLSHLAFLFGVVLAGPVKLETLDAITKSDPFSVSARALFTVMALGIVGNVAIIVDAIVTSSLSLTDRLGGGALSVIRNEQFASQVLGIVGPAHRLEQLAPFSLLAIALAILLPSYVVSDSRRRLFKWALVGTLLLLLFNGLFVRGGRADFAILLLVCLVCSVLDPSRKLYEWVKSRSFGQLALFCSLLGSIVIAGMLYYSTVFVENRSSGISGLLSLAQHHRMNVSPLTMEIVGHSKPAQYGLLTLSYLVSPISTFSYYFDLRDAAFPGPFWGQYNFPMLAPRVMRLAQFAEARYWWDIRFEVFAPLTFQGFGGNVWATILRDLAIDFGWFGVPFILTAFGFLSKLVLRRGLQTRSVLMIACYSLFAPVLILSFAHSQLFVQSLFGAFLFSLIMMAVIRFRRRKPRVKSINRDARLKGGVSL